VEKELKGLLKNLQEAFKKKSGGLDLALGFHDSDDRGDRYDEVNGLYWWVDGMYQLTAAGKRFRKDVTRKFFVQFG
jgi:hypothetical protein